MPIKDGFIVDSVINVAAEFVDQSFALRANPVMQLYARIAFKSVLLQGEKKCKARGEHARMLRKAKPARLGKTPPSVLLLRPMWPYEPVIGSSSRVG